MWRWSIVFLLTCAGATTRAADQLEIVASRDGLPNVLGRLRAGEPATIAYLGASITNGAGASNSDATSWRALTTAGLRARYPRAKVTEVSRNTSGLGSTLGAFRLQRDVLAAAPDLVFVEFAVNDLDTPEPRIVRAMEGIVRQIRARHRATDICFVYTLHQAMLDDYKTGRLPASVAAHERVAAHYGIPSVNVGLAAARSLLGNELAWPAFSIDVCHPTDAGYRMFAGTLRDFLEAESARARPRVEHPFPARLRADCWDNVAMLDATARLPQGWEVDRTHTSPALPHLASSQQPGAEYAIKFHGDTIGLYLLAGPDTGEADYRIDTREWRVFRPFQYDFHHQYHTPTYFLIADDLAAGPHTLTVRVRETKDPRSQGRWIRIGDFLVNGARSN
jgi:sialidase-1